MLSTSIQYSLIMAGIVIIVGFAMIMKAGSKWGWLLVAAGAIYGFIALQPVIRDAQSRNRAPVRGGYYREK